MTLSEGDLVALCSPRPLTGVEHFGGNELSGYSNVIKEYAGLDRDKPLPVLIPHGVVLNDTYVSAGEKRAGYPAVFSYPAYRDSVYSQRMGMMVIASASPFLYALEVVEPAGAMREGVLFFPAHSLPGIQAEQDWEDLARRLSSTAHEWHPVRVCLHWADVLAGKHRVFMDSGLPVVSAGHSHDPEFIVRLITLLRQHKYVGSNAPGSHLFYAVAAGCEFFFLGSFHGRSGGERSLSLESAPASPDIRAELLALRELAASPGHANSDVLQRVTAKYLRADAFMSRETMRNNVYLCAELDRRGSFFARGVPSWQGPLPRAWYRWLKESAARVIGRRRKAR